MADRNEKGQFIAGNGAAKGNSGGPGRPKRSTEERYLRALSRHVTLKDWAKIVDTAVARAKAGDATARQWLSDYLMGKPVQRQEIGGKGGGELVLRVVYGDDGTHGHIA